MCGIVGYVGHQNAIPVLMQGLSHLEYRGYDSAGIACIENEKNKPALTVIKEKGKLSVLKDRLKNATFTSHLGIGHTRWATHGEPSQINAHPHLDYTGRIALIHNGIIENYSELKKELQKEGVQFKSQTDTEIAANLIGFYYKKDLVEGFRKAASRLRGFFAFVIISKDEPDRLLAFKRSNPLVIGLGENENFVASDVPALLPYTRKILYLEDDEYAIVTNKQVEIFSLKTGKPIQRKPVEILWTAEQAQKGGYPHFMLKEIYEQPRVLEEILTKRVNPRKEISFDTLNKNLDRKLCKIKRAVMVSCGTAYHAGLIASIMMEEYARIPSRAQVSSEFRYSDPILNQDDMVILVTQSGETADTLAALREAKAKKAFTLAIVNVVGSTIAREADAVIYTHAGPEIGVASTKAYLAQLVTLALLTFYLGKLRHQISQSEMVKFITEFQNVPEYAQKILQADETIKACANKYFKCSHFLFLGRGYNFPTALEGALKLKEISYAHAHGYAAGEMKHGPIALIDSEQPVICIAPQSKTYEKIISNIEEIRARKGIVIAIGTGGDKEVPRLSEDFFPIPSVREVFSPLLTVLPLQLFAYHIAVMNNRDVDQPRNLAKSVTVE